MNIISLVAGDTLANLQVNLVRQDTGAVFPIPLGEAGNVHLYIRKKGTTTIVADIEYETLASNPDSGYLLFELGDWVQNTEAAYYEGEIEITYEDLTVQTVFDQINFRVRSAIG